MEGEERTIIVDGEPYVVRLIKRPFREGIEARVTVKGTELVVGDLGLGQAALQERLSAEIRRVTQSDQGSS